MFLSLVTIYKKGLSPWNATIQTAALPSHEEEEETDKTKQEQIEQTYGKTLSLALSSTTFP